MISARETALQLINSMPESKLSLAVLTLEKIYNSEIESVQPDEWDLELIAQAEIENDGNTIALDALLKELSIAL